MIDFIYIQVVGQQPMMGEQHIEVGVKPSNYLAFSIVNMLCCCFILGVIALVYSLQVCSSSELNKGVD